MSENHDFMSDNTNFMSDNPDFMSDENLFHVAFRDQKKHIALRQSSSRPPHGDHEKRVMNEFRIASTGIRSGASRK